MTIQQPAVDLTQPGPDEKRRFPVFSKHHTTVATVLALCAWTVAVFDFGLFGTLLPAMQQEFGWTATEAYAINTWIAVGTAIVCFGIGPVIDRLGRRKGMMTTVGGTAIVSGLTALIPTGIPFLSNGLLILVRSFGGLGFSEQDFGNVTSAFFAGSLIGSIGYGIYCRSVRLSTLLHLSILAAIVSNAVYWQLGSLTSAYGISVLAGAAYMTGTLIQLDLIARIIPPRAAATLFAIVMALTNFAGSASEAFGGWLFEAAKLQARDGFSTVVAISVAFAASCWLLVPMLRRAAPQWWQ